MPDPCLLPEESEEVHSTSSWCCENKCDASISEDGWVGLGAVARDHEGSVLCAAMRRTNAYWPPPIAEAKALLLAAKLGRRMEFEEVLIETDCKELTSRLSKGATHLTDLDAVLSDVLFLCSSFSRVNWVHVCHDGNFVAHYLARLIPFGDEQIWFNHAPVEVEPYVNMDTLLIE
ncbi:Petrobactin import ATP-binding protein FpuD [Bienertia sinuspersici]